MIYTKYVLEQRDRIGCTWATLTGRITSRFENGDDLTPGDLASALVTQHLHNLWRDTADRVEQDGTDPVVAILQVRARAERHLFDTPPIRDGGLMDQAVADCHRDACQRYLRMTSHVAESARISTGGRDD